MEGRMVLDGEAFDVRGTGYHEQGRFSFPLYEFTEAWYWLHIEHPPWTILTGTGVHPPGLLKPKKETRGGFACVLKEGKRLLATADISGLLVNWQRIDKHAGLARLKEQRRVADEADARPSPGIEEDVRPLVCGPDETSFGQSGEQIPGPLCIVFIESGLEGPRHVNRRI